jgi:hypothetical protein
MSIVERRPDPDPPGTCDGHWIFRRRVVETGIWFSGGALPISPASIGAPEHRAHTGRALADYHRHASGGIEQIRGSLVDEEA